MKILPVEKIREADAYTILHEPISPADLMERAASACYRWLRKRVDPPRRVVVFCGPGNNGGDGLVIARLLARDNFEVEVSNLDSEKFPPLGPEDVVIDAIFGSGLSRPAEGHAARAIRHINNSESLVVAIDFPSGLMGDVHTDEKAGPIVKADYTLSFQFPKLAFMFAENDPFVGEWEVLPIGLSKEFIRNVEVKNHYIRRKDVKGIIRPRTRYSHKGNYGHALLIAGSFGKMGASIMASRACLRSGVGLLHTHAPLSGYPIIQTAVPEAMVTIDPDDKCFSQAPDLTPFSAIAIGPGIGFDEKTKNALKLLIQNTTLPLILDADAITILGENKTWIPFVPKNSIYTPHPKEFERLVGPARNDFHRNQQQREFSVKYGVYVVLKGAHSCISSPDGNCYFNSTGNPGMATGGSGDVLTGLILGLMAQRYTSLQACLLGTFLHGLAGDLAAEKFGMEAVIASDLVDQIGNGFRRI